MAAQGYRHSCDAANTGLQRSSHLEEYTRTRPASAGNRPRSLLNKVAAQAQAQLVDDENDCGADSEPWELAGWGNDPSVSDFAQQAAIKQSPYTKDTPTPLVGPTGSGRRILSAGPHGRSSNLKPADARKRPPGAPQQPPQQQQAGQGRPRPTQQQPQQRPGQQQQQQYPQRQQQQRQQLMSLEVGDESDVEPSTSYAPGGLAAHQGTVPQPFQLSSARVPRHEGLLPGPDGAAVSPRAPRSLSAETHMPGPPQAGAALVGEGGRAGALPGAYGARPRREGAAGGGGSSSGGGATGSIPNPSGIPPPHPPAGTALRSTSLKGMSGSPAAAGADHPSWSSSGGGGGGGNYSHLLPAQASGGPMIINSKSANRHTSELWGDAGLSGWDTDPHSGSGATTPTRGLAGLGMPLQGGAPGLPPRSSRSTLSPSDAGIGPPPDANSPLRLGSGGLSGGAPSAGTPPRQPAGTLAKGRPPVQPPASYSPSAMRGTASGMSTPPRGTGSGMSTPPPERDALTDFCSGRRAVSPAPGSAAQRPSPGGAGPMRQASPVKGGPWQAGTPPRRTTGDGRAPGASGGPLDADPPSIGPRGTFRSSSRPSSLGAGTGPAGFDGGGLGLALNGASYR